MKSNDLSRLWTETKNLRDACRDPLTSALLDLAMLAIVVERDRNLDDAEPLDSKET